jgi:2-iminobutanoate/2-iminopropanoate deaminase
MRARLAAAAALALCGCHPLREHYPPPDPTLPFSNAVRVGNTLFLAGHLGLDPATGRAPADAAVEAGLLLDAFGATLARAGFGFDDLVSVEVHCSDVGLYDTFNAAYRQRFGGAYPARAFLGSGPLLRGCRFEMLGTARR